VSRRSKQVVGAVAAVLGIGVAAWIVVPRGHHGPSAHFNQTLDYLPGVAADIYLPAPSQSPTPTVVLIPGGGWRSSDRRGLAGLAESLAGSGLVVVNATYRAANAGVRFPVPVSDIVCAIDFSADRARAAGFLPGPLIVLGHSSGAHLAALAALNGAHFRNSCPYPPAEPDGLIGLAGPYDISEIPSIAEPLFGATPAAEPEAWHDGNPLNLVGQRTGSAPLAVLLAHGASDQTVPVSFSASFALALQRAGHPVDLTILPGVGHSDIYRPAVIADRALSWIRSLPS